MEGPFNLHFEVSDDGTLLFIEASWRGRRVAGGGYTPEQTDAVIEALRTARERMEQRESCR